MKKLLLLLMVIMLFIFAACGLDVSPQTNEPPYQNENEEPYGDNVYDNGTYEPLYQNEGENIEPDENGTEIDIDTLDWIDLEMVSIPSVFSYEEVGLVGGIVITSDILNSHAIAMYVGPLMGDFETLVDNAESFAFDDGHVGLFMESFDYGVMGWIREDGNLITLRHGGDMSIFTDNEELILQIVRSLR